MNFFMNQGDIIPEEIDWEYQWKKKLENREGKLNKDWNKVAPHFKKANSKDEYLELLLSKIILSPEDSVLDLGCGEGSVTIPLSQRVKKVTGVDSAYKMIEILDQRIEEENITNIATLVEKTENVTRELVGEYDIVVASRSMNGILDLRETITNINNIAQKYVFITLFGPNNKKLERSFSEYLGKPYPDFPNYDYFFNLLFSMGIYANIENLGIKTHKSYNSIEEAIGTSGHGSWKIDNLTPEELDKLHTYLEGILVKNPETGLLENPMDKAEWILIWWKKE